MKDNIQGFLILTEILVFVNTDKKEKNLQKILKVRLKA